MIYAFTFNLYSLNGFNYGPWDQTKKVRKGSFPIMATFGGGQQVPLPHFLFTLLYTKMSPQK